MSKSNRNAPCYCGSGKKTKKCCGDSEKDARHNQAMLDREQAEARVLRQRAEALAVKMVAAGHTDDEGCDCPYCRGELPRRRRLRGQQKVGAELSDSQVAADQTTGVGTMTSGGGTGGAPTVRSRAKVRRSQR